MTKIKNWKPKASCPLSREHKVGMLLERIEEQDAKRIAAEHGGTAHPPEFKTWWGWDVFVPVSAEEALA